MDRLSLREQIWTDQSNIHNSNISPSMRQVQADAPVNMGGIAAPLAAAKALYAADLARQVEEAKQREAAARAASRQEAAESTGLGVGGADYDRQRMARQQQAAMQRVNAATAPAAEDAPRRSIQTHDGELPGGGGLRLGSRSDYDRVRMRQRQQHSTMAPAASLHSPAQPSLETRAAHSRADSPDLPGGGGLHLSSHDKDRARQAALHAERAAAAAAATASRGHAGSSPGDSSAVQQRSFADAEQRRHTLDQQRREEEAEAARDKAAAQAAYAAALQQQIQQKAPQNTRSTQPIKQLAAEDLPAWQQARTGAGRSGPAQPAAAAAAAPPRATSPDLPGGGGLRIGSKSDYDRQRMQRRQEMSAAHVPSYVPAQAAHGGRSPRYAQPQESEQPAQDEYMPIVRPGEYFPSTDAMHGGAHAFQGPVEAAPVRQTPPYLQHRGRADPTRGPVDQHAAVSLRNMHNGTPDQGKLRAQLDAKQRYRLELEEQMAAVAARKAAAKAATAAEDEDLLRRMHQQRASSMATGGMHDAAHQQQQPDYPQQNHLNHHEHIQQQHPTHTGPNQEPRRGVLGTAGANLMQQHPSAPSAPLGGDVGVATGQQPPRAGGVSSLQAGMTDEQIEAKKRAGADQARALQAQIEAKAAAKAAAARAEAEFELAEERRVSREQAELAEKHRVEVEAEAKRAAAAKEEEERAANAAMAKAKRQAKAAEAARAAAEEAAADARVERERKELAERYARDKRESRPLDRNSEQGVGGTGPLGAQGAARATDQVQHQATGAARRQDLFGPSTPEHQAHTAPDYSSHVREAAPHAFPQGQGVPPVHSGGRSQWGEQYAAPADGLGQQQHSFVPTQQGMQQGQQHYEQHWQTEPMMAPNTHASQHPAGHPPHYNTGHSSFQPQQPPAWAASAQMVQGRSAMETSMLDGSSHFVDFSATSSANQSREMQPIEYSKTSVWKLQENKPHAARAPTSPLISPQKQRPDRPASSQAREEHAFRLNASPRVSTAPSQTDVQSSGLHGDTVKLFADDREMETNVPVADLVGNLRRQLGVASRSGARPRHKPSGEHRGLPLTARSLQGQSAWIGEGDMQGGIPDSASSAASVSDESTSQGIPGDASSRRGSEHEGASQGQSTLAPRSSRDEALQQDTAKASPQRPSSSEPWAEGGTGRDSASAEQHAADTNTQSAEKASPPARNEAQSRASSAFSASKDDWLGALAGEDTASSHAFSGLRGNKGQYAPADDDFSDTVSVGNMSVMSLKSTTDYEGLAQRNAARLAYLRDLELAYNTSVGSPRASADGASASSTAATQPAASMIDSVLQQYLSQAGLPADAMDKSVSLPKLQLAVVQEGKTAFPAIDTTEPLGSSRQTESMPAPSNEQYDFANGGLKPTPQQQHPSAQFAARASGIAVPETVHEEASARSKSGKAHKHSKRRSNRSKRKHHRRHKSASSSDWSSVSSSSSSASSGSDSSARDEGRPMSATERSALAHDTRTSMHLVPSHAQSAGYGQAASTGFHTAAMQSYQVPQTVYVQSMPQAMPMYSSAHMGMPIGPMASYGMPMQYMQQPSMPPVHHNAPAASDSRGSRSQHRRSKSQKAKKSGQSEKRHSSQRDATKVQTEGAQSAPLQAGMAYDVATGGTAPDTYRSLQGNSSWLQRD